jgi:hypothetical protein
MLGWLNSELITTLIELQSNDGKFMSSIIKHLPWKDIGAPELASIESLTKLAVSAIRRVSCYDETNGGFSGIPVADSLDAVSGKLTEILNEARATTAICDAQINQIVYEAYAIERAEIVALRQQLEFVDAEDENADLSEEDECLETSVTLTESARRIVSICAGVVFNRWSVTGVSGLASDLPPESVFELLTACSPAEDTALKEGDAGVRVDDPESGEDIVRLVQDVMESIWNDRADEIERDVCEAISVKKLRDYFRKAGAGGFWDDHIKRYSKSRRKAPIYWLLQSARRNYSLWLYYHKLDRDILFKALVNLVEPKLRLEGSRLQALRGEMVGDTGTGAKRLAKEIERQEDFISELQDFEEKLRRAANLHLVPDLNDGVVLNIAPLHELVPWKEAKNYWEELLEGKYGWSSIGKQLLQKGLVK